jgi:hypothetical protein
MAKKAVAASGSAKAVLAGKQIKTGSFNGTVRAVELPDKQIRIEVAMTRKDAAGRLWTSGVSGVGATQELALVALEEAFAKSPMQIRSIAEHALAAAGKVTPMIRAPIAAIDLNVLPDSKLRELAAGRPEIPADADRATLIKKLDEARQKSLEDKGL